ncbi:MAG: DUF4625 domain-containing protein [Prolixibacteraceae bacterium]
MKKFYIWCIPAILLVVSVSCKKSTTETPVPIPDKTLPTISLVDPASGKSFVLGTPLHLQMDLSDNVELKSYKVTIAKSLKGTQTSDWGFSQTWIVPAGKKTFAVNHSEIIVPATITGNPTTIGNYDFSVTCWDSSDNQTSATLTVALTK